MEIYNETILLYRSLGNGQSLAGELCPKCKGGRTKERTLSVSRDERGQLVWLCHRVSCGFKGRDSNGGGSIQDASPKSKTKARDIPEVTSLKDIPAKARELLEERYSLTPRHIEDAKLGWTNERAEKEGGAGRLYVPVFNWKGLRDGYILRSLTGAKPKALTFVKSGSMAWYHKPESTKVILVEDQLSAIRLSKYVTSVALLGTHLNPSRIHTVLSAKATDYYLWLDGDAFNLAVQYAIKYKHLIKLHVLKLNRDIKDMDEPELNVLLRQEDVI